MKEQSRTKMLAHDIPLRFVKLLNVILMTIPFAWCWYGYYVGQMENSFYKKGNLLMLVLFMLVYFMFARVYSAFLVSVNRISEMVYSQVLAVLITDGITYLVIVLLVKGFPSVIPGLLAIARSDCNLFCMVYTGTSLVFPYVSAAEDHDRLRCP